MFRRLRSWRPTCDRISRLNPALNAIVTLAPDVLDRARAVEGDLGGLGGGIVRSAHHG